MNDDLDFTAGKIVDPRDDAGKVFSVLCLRANDTWTSRFIEHATRANAEVAVEESRRLYKRVILVEVTL